MNNYRCFLLLALMTSLFAIGCGRSDRSPLSQAKLLLHEDKFADAQKVCDELLTANPTTDDPVKNRIRFEGLLVRGQVFQEGGDLDQAQADYSAAIALEQKNPDGYYFRSKLFRLRADEAKKTSKIDEAEAYDQASMDDYRLYTKFDPEAGIAYPNDFESKPMLLDSYDPLSDDPLGNEELTQDPVKLTETPEAFADLGSRFDTEVADDADDAEAFNAEALTNVSDGGELDKVDPSSNTVTVNKPRIALDELRKEQDETRRKIAALDLQSDLENAALLPHKDPQAADDQTVLPKPTTPVTRFDRPVVPQPNATDPGTNFPTTPRRATTGITSQQQPTASQPNTPRNGFGMRNKGTGTTGYGGSRYGGSGSSPNGFGSRTMGFQQPYNNSVPSSGNGFSTVPPSYGTSPNAGRTTGYISDGGVSRGVRQSRMLPQQFGNTGSYFAPQLGQNRQVPSGQSQTQAATPGTVPGGAATKPISTALPLNVLDGLMNGTPIPPYDPLPR